MSKMRCGKCSGESAAAQRMDTKKAQECSGQSAAAQRMDTEKAQKGCGLYMTDPRGQIPGLCPVTAALVGQKKGKRQKSLGQYSHLPPWDDRLDLD